MCLIRSGCYHDQARLLIENGRVDEGGQLHCRRRVGLQVAPQLVALLDLWSDVRTQPEIVVPDALLAELNEIWALMPPPPEVPAWALERKQVGDRAEMYSVQFRRSQVANKSAIVWVSRDTDLLGWDVEDRSLSPPRYIEVKGRRDREEIFFLSDNEWKQATALGEQYEIHFWGGIDLQRAAAIEYSSLRAEGYPLVIRNPADAIANKEWLAEPIKWRLRREPAAE